MVIARNVQDTLDAQDVTAHKSHQQIQPGQIGFFGYRFIYTQAKSADMVVVAIDVMSVIMMLVLSVPMIMVMVMMVMRLVYYSAVIIGYIGFLIKPARNIRNFAACRE